MGTFDRNLVQGWHTDKNEIEKVIEIPIEKLIRNYKEVAPMYQIDQNNEYVYEINGPVFDVSSEVKDFGSNKGTIWGMSSRILAFLFTEIENNL